MSWFLGAYKGRGGRTLGIYVCRSIAGSDVLSTHAEGRAGDLGIPVGASWGQGLADALVAASGQLGIQCVIYRRRIWTSNRCKEGWRPYSGSNPHNDHAHVEVTAAAADNLTVATINRAMSARLRWIEGAVTNLPVLRKGAKGADVRRLQSLLAANGHPPARSFNAAHRPDGIFGAGTDAAVRSFQKAANLAVDGIAGKNTWVALLGAAR
jgi:hypothetical protein